jgi:uncharacterized protein YodC (DUF2158 family)
MAAKFTIGENVKVTPAPVDPAGPVEAMQMDATGNIQYLISWVDENSITQQRWFAEDQLVAA